MIEILILLLILLQIVRVPRNTDNYIARLRALEISVERILKELRK